MTPKMLLALRDAAANERTGGLHRSNAGWASESSIARWHNFRTVDALLAHGYLQVWGAAKGIAPYACITDAGVRMLDVAGFNADGSPHKGARA